MWCRTQKWTVFKAVLETGTAELMAIHCVIYQQTLNGKSVQISEVINVVVHIVNFIRKSALSHRQFKNFIAEIESGFLDISYHCEFCCLSWNNVLKKKNHFRLGIDICMTEKNRVSELIDFSWLWNLALLVDKIQLKTKRVNFKA